MNDELPEDHPVKLTAPVAYADALKQTAETQTAELTRLYNVYIEKANIMYKLLEDIRHRVKELELANIALINQQLSTATAAHNVAVNHLQEYCNKYGIKKP